MKKPLTLICRQKTKFILHIFLEILQRYCKLIVLGALGVPVNKPKVIQSTCRKSSCLFTGKNQLHPPCSTGDISKISKHLILDTYEWSHTPNMVVSTCTRLWCLSACKKQASSFTFLEILHFKESCNLIGWILPDMRLVVKYQQQY